MSRDKTSEAPTNLVRPSLGGVIAPHCGAFKSDPRREGLGKHTKGKVSPYHKPKNRKK